MGKTLYFLEAPGAQSEVLDWFRALRAAPEETPTDHGAVLYFSSFGPLVDDASGAIDPTLSPIVTVFSPTVRRGILWTVGEVHFRSTLHLDQNKSIRKVAKAFSKWLAGHPRVHDQSLTATNEFGYYLEGSSRNWSPIFALPTGLERLRGGGYFVSDNDNDFVLDELCRALRLRGVDCQPK